MADYAFKRMAATPKLGSLIQEYWVGEVTNARNQPFTHVATAQSRAQILFHYEGEFDSTDSSGKTAKNLVAGFYGPTLLPQRYSTSSNNAGIFGIQLTPFAIPALFSMPASELTNQTVALADLLGSKSTELEAKILAARTHRERAAVTSTFFEEKRVRPKSKFRGVEYAVTCIHRAKGQVNIRSLANLACLSPRQFERNFRELTGFSAQTYLRVLRFEIAMEKLAASPASLTDFSLERGYYDQAHFNHDFKLFTGLAPHAYVAEAYPAGE
jgi:AraC-like DNA-binding protein